MDGADLVAHGVADQTVVGIEHHKDLVHAELLRRRRRPDGFVVWAALEGDSLTPLVAPGLDGAVRRGDGVVAVGGGSDHWEEEKQRKETTFTSSETFSCLSCRSALRLSIGLNIESSLRSLSYW